MQLLLIGTSEMSSEDIKPLTKTARWYKQNIFLIPFPPAESLLPYEIQVGRARGVSGLGMA